MGVLRIEQPSDSLAQWNCNQHSQIFSQWHIDAPLSSQNSIDTITKHMMAYLGDEQQQRYLGAGVRPLDLLPTDAHVAFPDFNQGRGYDLCPSKYPFMLPSDSKDGRAMGMAMMYRPGIKTLVIGSRPTGSGNSMLHRPLRVPLGATPQGRTVTSPTGHVVCLAATGRGVLETGRDMRKHTGDRCAPHDELDILYISENKIPRMAKMIEQWGPDQIIMANMHAALHHVPPHKGHDWHPDNPKFIRACRKNIKHMAPPELDQHGLSIAVWRAKFMVDMKSKGYIRDHKHDVQCSSLGEGRGFPVKVPMQYLAFWALVNVSNAKRKAAGKPEIGLRVMCSSQQALRGVHRVLDHYIDEVQAPKLFV